MLLHHEGAPRPTSSYTSWLTVWRSLVVETTSTSILVKLDRSLHSVLHRVRLLAVIITATAGGIMHVEIGPGW